MFRLLCLLFCTCSGIRTLHGEPVARHLREIPIQHPAFLALVERGSGSGPDLLVSSFGLFEESKEALHRDRITLLPDVGKAVGGAVLEPRVLVKNIPWPNEVNVRGEDASGARALLVSNGFLVPGRSTGGVTLLEVRGDRVVSQLAVTRPRGGWFYHRAEEVDLDGDGRTEILTARARVPLTGPARGELVMLERPPGAGSAARGVEDPHWEERVLTPGPDVHFRVHDLDGDGQVEVLAAEFFSRKLSLIRITRGDRGDLQVDRRVVDELVGAAFDLEVVDLEGDSQPEVLVTNHEKGSAGSVFAYEVPADLARDPWPRHLLLGGIQVRQPGIQSAAPGQAIAFHPRPARKGTRPWILVSGDGSRRVHLLIPRESAGRWAYEEKVLLERPSTIGQCLATDLDGDGWTEILVPGYDENRLHLLTFAPEVGGSPGVAE